MNNLNEKEKELQYILEALDNEIDRLLGQKHDIYEELIKIDMQKRCLEPPDITDGTIDLRCFSENGKSFSIFLSGTSEEIGTIDYRDYHVGKLLGDIGYTIFPEYQGHGYAYHALCLLSDILYSKGIPDFWVSTKEDNIPSLKTILKYGGILINQNKDILCYECQTRKLTKEPNNLR